MAHLTSYENITFWCFYTIVTSCISYIGMACARPTNFKWNPN